MNTAAFVALLMHGGKMRSERLGRFIGHIRHHSGLEPLLDVPGMLVLGALRAPHVMLPSGGGLIWGHLFDRNSNGRLLSTDEKPGLNAPAERFVERCWGGYAAFRMIDGRPEILRDPSGDVPCYHAVVDGVHLVTSRPALLFDCALMRPEIDWTILAQSLAFRDIRPARTALKGVSELHPGMAATVEEDRLEARCIWSPWTFTAERLEIRDAATAADLVRKTANQCLSAWGQCFEKPIVEISGGLDSAIVAAGLLSAGVRPTALTFTRASGDPDELPYATAIADRLGIKLHASGLDASDVDLNRSEARDLPRPSTRNFSQAMDRPVSELAERTGADAFFSGGGGDNVFCHIMSALPVLDRLYRCGPLGVPQTAIDIARLTEVTVWEVIATAARQAGRGKRSLPPPRRNRFLADAATERLPVPVGHPWLEAIPSALPAKRRHVWSLIGIQNHMEGYARLARGPIVSPLLSQPLVELCLRIPTWLWCEGGSNRAVARTAYRDLLPAAVIERRSKGVFDSFGARIINSNRALLRGMLSSGGLAREGLLSIESVTRYLDHALLDGEGIVQLLALADVEAWLQAWEKRLPPAA